MPPLLFATFLSNDPSNRILVCSSTDGTHWNGGVEVGQHTKTTASQVFFKGKFWAVFVANNSKNTLLVCSSDDAIHWSRNTELPESTKGAPSLIVFKSQLWLAFQSNEKYDDVAILMCSSADGVRWTKNAKLPYGSHQSPSLTVFQGKLWIAFVQNIWVEEYQQPELLFGNSEDGIHWKTPAIRTNLTTGRAPSLAAFQDRLYAAYTSNQSTGLRILSSSDGAQWKETSISASSKAAPFLAVYDNHLWMSFIENQGHNPIAVISSEDGKSWSKSEPVNQQSPVAVSLFTRSLYMGIVRPKYQIVTVVYAPPGTHGGNSSSQVEYSSGSTLGTTTSTSSSFKSGVSVSMSVGFAGSSVDSDFGYSTTSTDSTSIEVQKVHESRVLVKGSSQNGIDHDYDTFYLWLNPEFRVTLDNTNTLDSQLDINGTTMLIQYVYVSWLKNPSTMPAGLKQILNKAGLTEEDYAEILKTNPFASGESKLDPDRYLPTTHSFPYLPPPKPNDPVPTLTYTQKSTLARSASHTAQTQYNMGYSVTAGIDGLFKASLKTSQSLEWTNSATTGSSKTSAQQASVTIGGPSYGYDGPTDVRVYWDTVFSSFVFRFAEEAPSVSGRLIDAEGSPVASEPVTLAAGHNEFTTFTDHQGGFRFYGASGDEGEVSARDKRLKVQLGAGQPLASLAI